MATKVGNSIKKARTDAGLTQEKLAKKVGGGVSASDIGKAERGEEVLPAAALRKIAIATGVTQTSLVNAGKTTGKTTAAEKKTKAAKPRTPTNAGVSMRVTTTEKKLLEYYRVADSNTKKAATNVLKGACSDMVDSLAARSGAAGQNDNAVADMISSAIGSLLGKK